jgi:peptidoglycan/LPS O-acetylase OafA/YrhL
VRRLSIRGLTFVAGLIAAGSWALRLVAFRYGLTDGLFTYTWFTADGLALGALMAIALRSRYASRANTTLLAGSLIVMGIVTLTIGMPYGILTRQSALGAALQRVPFLLVFAGSLLAILLIGSGRYARFTQPRVLRFFGEISYGLYLIHLLIFSGYDAVLRTLNISDGMPHRRAVAILIRFIVASGVSVLIAYWSRWRFEEWFLKKKDRQFSWRGQTVDAFARSEP